MAKITMNSVVCALPHDVQRELGGLAREQSFTPNQLLIEENTPIAQAFFPANGVISVVGPMEDGSTAESYTAGSDGIVGADLLLGVDRIAQRATCQIPGTFYTITASEFLALAEKHESFRLAILKNVHYLLALTAQSAACNLLHGLSERLARWLLIAHDRVQSDEFVLTQEIMATMLGVHRPAVSIAAGSLQKAGFISYSRGRITVTDRAGLESASCECYRIIDDVFIRCFPK
jgi:CRP-like cAMP-binding protein